MHTNTESQSMQRARVLSVFSLVMITVTSVDSVRNLPATAMFGSALITFFALAAILFLIPTAMVSAELAAMLPKQGGIYVWVKEAFGKRFGYLAIWFQWIENVIWYPTILAFISGTLAYLISPSLGDNPYYITVTILVTFWGATFLNLFGMRISSRFSIFCGMVGLILPMFVIIVLGCTWILNHHPVQISFSRYDLFPHFNNPHLLVAITGIILSFCGMEITTVYAQEVKNPQKDYPKALLISTVILVFTLTLGSLAIAMVIPGDKISLVQGIMQAFHFFFGAYHLEWLVPVMGFLIIIGGIGSLSNWIIAPSKGLLIAAQDGNLPAFLCRENRYGAPTILLIVQACLVSVFSMAFVFLPTINSSYWLLTALAAQLYMIMYIMMFAAAIYLRFKAKDLARPFAVPGGKFGMFCIAGAGLFSSVFTIIVGFFPPQDIHIKSFMRYESTLVIGLLLMCILPLLVRTKNSNTTQT